MIQERQTLRRSGICLHSFSFAALPASACGFCEVRRDGCWGPSQEEEEVKERVDVVLPCGTLPVLSPLARK